MAGSGITTRGIMGSLRRLTAQRFREGLLESMTFHKRDMVSAYQQGQFDLLTHLEEMGIFEYTKGGEDPKA